ncbi:Phosphopantothenoylcysteine decarboxylase (PPCDC) (Halotolerance protein HAL3) (OsHAL3), partial [Durusdinium trenchii]
RPRVIVGACGSVAAVKVPEIVARLHDGGAEVRVVLTKSAEHFIKESSRSYNATWHARFAELQSEGFVATYLDEHEWRYKKVGKDPVVHIELRKWADLMLVAPLSANTLAKLAGGLCDNLLTCVARAWDLSKPLVVAPAMNSFMWAHPLTAAQLGSLKSMGVQVIDPIIKTLACGDTGSGALASVDSIVEQVLGAADIPSPIPAPQVAFHVVNEPLDEHERVVFDAERELAGLGSLQLVPRVRDRATTEIVGHFVSDTQYHGHRSEVISRCLRPSFAS